MRWTALNGVGASLWVGALLVAGTTGKSGALGAVVPTNPLLVATILGGIGLATLLWANLVDI